MRSIEKTIIQCCLIALFVLTIYYPTIFAPFNPIDDIKMTQHLLNADGIDFYHIFCPKGSGQYYRPVLYLTFLLDTFAWGLLESFMHLENILLHLGSSILVYILARQLVKAQQLNTPWLPMVTAMMFGLHPIATEPVNWVSGRTDLLAAFFVLTSQVLFFQSIHKRSFLYGLAGAMAMLLGCLSKETALFILPAVLLWCLIPPRDGLNGTSLRLRAGLFLVFASSGFFYLFLRRLALTGGDKILSTLNNGNIVTGNSFDLVDIVRVGLKTFGFYFKKLIIPVPLNFAIVEISANYLWIGLLVIAGICWCLYKRTIVAYLFVSAFCLISPASMLPLLKITWTPVAERYVYIASALFILASMLFVVNITKGKLNKMIGTLVIIIILASSSIVTAQRNIIWQDNYSLFKDTVGKSPNFHPVKNELAYALLQRGESDAANTMFLSNGSDDYMPSSLNKIRVYVNQGKFEYAHHKLLEFKKRGALDSKELLELLNYINERRWEHAISIRQRQAIDLEILATEQKLLVITGDPFYHYLIGKVQLRLGDNIAAKQSFSKAWCYSPARSHYREAARKLAERL